MATYLLAYHGGGGMAQDLQTITGLRNDSFDSNRRIAVLNLLQWSGQIHLSAIHFRG